MLTLKPIIGRTFSQCARAWRQRSKNWVLGFKLIFVPLGIAALVYRASREHSVRFVDAWNAYLLAGVLLSQVSICFFALRFRRVMRVVGLRLSVREALHINALSMFYHFFVPLAAGADVTRYIKLRGLAPERRPVAMAGGIVLDHIVGLGTLIMIAVILTVLLKPTIVTLDTRVLIFAAVVVVCVAAAAGVSIRQSSSLKVAELVRRLQGHKLDVAQAVALSLAMQLLTAAAVFMGSIGWGIGIGFHEILLVLTASFIFQALPFNVGGVGAADIAGTGLYIAIGLTPAAALLLVSLMYCYRLLVAVTGGICELASTRR